MSDPELLDRMRLALVPGIGPRLTVQLLERFGAASRVLAASGPELLTVDGIGGKLSAAITAARTSPAAEQELAACERRGIQVLGPDSPSYPGGLREIPDPPQVLYVRGELMPRDGLAIGIVGSRQCTQYGRQTAERLAAGLARAGLTIISGLARGIDAAAHRGALAAGGRTIAVCAPGLATIYPPEHDKLAEEIASQGALLSESPLDRAPSPGLFPQRNRVISGLSLGVILVEAGRGSGALHTARHAMEQGREVFAVPGRIDNPASFGCHDLIRDGVTLLRSVDDVLETLGPLMTPVQTAPGEVVAAPRELLLNDVERAVLQAAPLEPLHLDELHVPGLELPQVLATLTVLEMKRLIRRLPGGYIVRRTS